MFEVYFVTVFSFTLSNYTEASCMGESYFYSVL